MSDTPTVVIYSSNEAEAIVSHEEEDGMLVLIAWRSKGATAWVCSDNISTVGKLPAATTKPHPEADRVLTEFTAWRLTQ